MTDERNPQDLARDLAAEVTELEQMLADEWLRQIEDFRLQISGAGRNRLARLISEYTASQLAGAVPQEELREVIARWHKQAWDKVPPEYASRNLQRKYLRLDNEAAGVETCADELESLVEKRRVK